MRRFALLCAALIGVAILAYSLSRPRHAAPSAPAIDLRAGGVLLLDGKAVSLAALQKECAGKPVVDLHVQDSVPWGHVGWVMMALQPTGVREVRFDLRHGVVATCLKSHYWQQDARHLPGGHLAGVVAVGADELGEPGLAGRLADEAKRIRRDYGLDPLGEVLPDPPQPFGVVAPALEAFCEAGIEIEFSFCSWPEHAVPDYAPLPPLTDLAISTASLWRCRCRPGVVEVDLPVADQGKPEGGWEMDERLAVTLDRDGRVYAKQMRSGAVARSVDLDDLGAFLHERKELYELKTRQMWVSPRLREFVQRTSWSELYVLVRADRTAPARQVGWILHVLAQEGFYKVQFAVRREPGADEEGPCVDESFAKLEVFLPMSHLPDLVSHGEPAIDVYVDPAAFGVGKARPRGLAEVANLLRAERKVISDDLHVAILHVAPGTAHERVVAAVNEIYRARIKQVEFAGLDPPDAATRLLSPLPR